MLDNYNFNPALNREKLLAFTPPARSSFSSLASEMPDTDICLRELEKLCRQEKELPNSLFDKHIGENATYSSKELLKDELKLIYCCFIDKNPSHQLSDDRRSQLVDLLTQDISACTAGFHNRVNLVLDQLTQPENLAQLLYNGRECLAAAITEEMLKGNKNFSVGRGDEVHFGNRVRMIANLLGLGIKPILGSDPYYDQHWDDHIEKGLKEIFETYLTPFYLPTLLTNQIKNLLLTSGYSGFKEEGYAIGLVDEFMLMLRKFMPSLCANKNDDYLRQRYLQIETDKDDMPYIRDINWFIFKQDLCQVLQEEGYFKKSPTPRSLADVIQQCFLFNKWKNFGVHYKALEKEFPSHLTSGFNFRWFIVSLAPTYRTVVFEACKDKLPAIIKDGADFHSAIECLTPNQRAVVFAACKDKLPAIIKDGADFGKAICLLTPNQRSVVFEGHKNILPNVIKNFYHLRDAVQYLILDQRAAVIIACKDILPNVIKNLDHLRDTVQYLTRDQYAAVIIACKDILPTIIKDGADLGWVVQSLTLDECTAIVKSCKDRLPTIITISADFNRVLEQLTLEQRTVIFEAYKDILPTIIKGGYDLGWALKYLTLDQRTVVFEACKDILPTIIENSDHLKHATQYLTLDQHTAVIIACKDTAIIQDAYGFRWIMEQLTPAQRTEVFEASKNILPTLIKDIYNLREATKYLTPDQHTAILIACKDKLSTIIKDGTDFSGTLQSLTYEQCIAVMTACKDILPTIIKDSTDFSKAIQHLIPDQRIEVVKACKDLPFIIEFMKDILKENNKVQTLNYKKQEQFFNFIRQYEEIERKSENIMQGIGKYFFKKISQEKKSILESILHDGKYISKIKQIREARQYYNDDLVDIKNYLNNLESTITINKINVLKRHRGLFKLHDTESDKLVIKFKGTITRLKQEVESAIPKEPIIKLADFATAL